MLAQAKAIVALDVIGAFFNIAPLWWHIKQLNTAPACLIGWVIVALMFDMMNLIIWRNDAEVRIRGFCDVSQKIHLIAPIGLLCSLLCVLHFLFSVLSKDAASYMARDRRKRCIYELLFCIGVPIVFASVHIIIQPRRTTIARVQGCLVSLYPTWPTFILYYIWPPVISSVGLIFSSFVVWRLVNHRRQLNSLISHTKSAISLSRFTRLLLLAGANIIMLLPVCIYRYLISAPQSSGTPVEYTWDFIHKDFQEPQQFEDVNTLPWDPWIKLAVALLVIIFFGFGVEARSAYWQLFKKIGLDKPIKFLFTKRKVRQEGEHELVAVKLPKDPSAALDSIKIHVQRSDDFL